MVNIMFCLYYKIPKSKLNSFLLYNFLDRQGRLLLYSHFSLVPQG